MLWSVKFCILSDTAVTNDNLSSTPLITAEAANPSSDFESSPEETAKVDSLDEPSVQEKPVLPERKKILMESDCSGHQLNPHSMSFLANSESSNENPLRYSDLSLDTRWVVFKDYLVLALAYRFLFMTFLGYNSLCVLRFCRLKPPAQPGTPIIDVKPEIALGPVSVIS